MDFDRYYRSSSLKIHEIAEIAGVSLKTAERYHYGEIKPKKGLYDYLELYACGFILPDWWQRQGFCFVGDKLCYLGREFSAGDLQGIQYLYQHNRCLERRNKELQADIERIKDDLGKALALLPKATVIPLTKNVGDNGDLSVMEDHKCPRK